MMNSDDHVKSFIDVNVLSIAWQKHTGFKLVAYKNF